MGFFKLLKGAHTSGQGADAKFFAAGDPQASTVESTEDLAALEPLKFAVSEGPEPPAEGGEPEEPPPPPAGDAERAAAQAFANDSLGLTPKAGTKPAPRPAGARPAPAAPRPAAEKK